MARLRSRAGPGCRTGTIWGPGGLNQPMRTTTLWAAATLLGTAAPALAKNTPKENNPNLDAPFVRNLRADRPGQTVTAQMLCAGQFWLEAGALRQLPRAGTAG